MCQKAEEAARLQESRSDEVEPVARSAEEIAREDELIETVTNLIRGNQLTEDDAVAIVSQQELAELLADANLGRNVRSLVNA